MSVLIWIIVGGIAGWLASIITGDDPRMGLFTNIIVGIVGSLIGGTLVTLFQTGSLDFTSSISGFNLASIIISTLGAIVLLVLIKAFRNPSQV